MTNVFTFTGNTTGKIDANDAATDYIIAAGANVAPASGFAIDGTSDAVFRSFEIDGHLGGGTGLAVGNDYSLPSDIHITVGATGVIQSEYNGILSKANGAVIANHGEIDAYWGIDARGSDLSIKNTGTINASTYGFDIASFGGTTMVKNSGTVDGAGGVGVSINGLLHTETMLVNTGTISGDSMAIQAYYAKDTVINKGTVNGGIDLYIGDDIYKGKGGVVHGVVDGSYGDDKLCGGAQKDLLAGGKGEDVLTGHGGADEFIFSTDSKADEVTDFHVTGVGHDRIDLRGMTGFTSFADLAGHMHEDGKDAVLDFGHGDVLTLDGVDFHTLVKGDFIF